MKHSQHTPPTQTEMTMTPHETTALTNLRGTTMDPVSVDYQGARIEVWRVNWDYRNPTPFRVRVNGVDLMGGFRCGIDAIKHACCYIDGSVYL